jgi:hypothetical protein
MQTLTKKQHTIYKKLCDTYDKEKYYLFISLQTFIQRQEDKSYYKKLRNKTQYKYEDIKAVRIYAENDF